MKHFRLISFFILLSTFVYGQTEEINKAKNAIAEVMKYKSQVFKTLDKDDVNYKENTRYGWGTEENIFVMEDKIEFKLKKKSIFIFFSDLCDYKITYTTDNFKNGGVILGEFLMMYKGEENAKKLFDNLIFIQNQIHNDKMEKVFGPQLSLFEPIAAQYRALKVKSSVSEEQRRFIVQANSFNEQKNYQKAIDMYNKAVETDQTSYPSAYSNMALLSAQIQNYNAAIFYMKKYLMLVPDADDARSCQDKIYVWEVQIGN